ncbi:BspA family leucine-rich repeat surface protein [Histomonas meleagridis]|uniref:BspA family leucine-rich repeat surface protein n=1 Tax=Histomonas meleagridis TaxID=135588 RepID=UPI00355AB423|nr:BspA family leucine-rich repeat surface protein [Histomonas meleagridis]
MMFLAFLANAIASEYVFDYIDNNLTKQEPAARGLTIFSDFINKRYTVEEFIRAIGLPDNETEAILGNITEFAQYFKLDFNLGDINLLNMTTEDQNFIYGLERLLFTNNKDITLITVLTVLGKIDTSSKYYIKLHEVDLGGFEAKWDLGIGRLLGIIGTFTDEISVYLSLFRDDLCPLIDSALLALNMDKCSLANLYDYIYNNKGWTLRNVLKTYLQMDLNGIKDIILMVLNIIAGPSYPSYSSNPITPEYIVKNIIGSDTTKLSHLFDIYQKFANIQTTKFETTLLWDGIYSAIDYAKDLLLYIKDTLLGEKIYNLFSYHIAQLEALPTVPLSTTCNRIVDFLDKFSKMGDDPTKLIYSMFNASWYFNASVMIKQQLIPFFQDLSSNNQDFVNLVVKHFNVTKEEVIFYVQCIHNCTSNVRGILDVFSAFPEFLGNQTLGLINQYIQEARKIAPEFDLDYNLKNIFTLINDEYNDTKSYEYYNLFINTIKEIADPLLSIADFGFVSQFNHTNEFNNSIIQYGQACAANILINTTEVLIHPNISRVMQEALEYIGAFRTKTVKGYLKEISKTTEADEVTQAGKVILDYVYPFIMNISRALNIDFLMQYLLDDLLQIRTIGTMLRDTDFNLKEALNLYYDNLGDLLDVIYEPLNKVSQNSTIINILKGIPTAFCNIEQSLNKFINTKVLSVYYASKCLIDAGDAVTDIKLRASTFIPIYRIFNACYGLSEYSDPPLSDECYLCQFAEALDVNLSFVKVLTYTVHLLDVTSCRQIIENLFELLTFDRNYWGEWIGKLNVLSGSIASGSTIDWSCPSDQTQPTEEPKYTPASAECKFAMTNFNETEFLLSISSTEEELPPIPTEDPQTSEAQQPTEDPQPTQDPKPTQDPQPTEIPTQKPTEDQKTTQAEPTQQTSNVQTFVQTSEIVEETPQSGANEDSNDGDNSGDNTGMIIGIVVAAVVVIAAAVGITIFVKKRNQNKAIENSPENELSV